MVRPKQHGTRGTYSGYHTDIVTKEGTSPAGQAGRMAYLKNGTCHKGCVGHGNYKTPCMPSVTLVDTN